MALAERELTPFSPAGKGAGGLGDFGSGGAASSIDDIAEKVYAGERISAGDALRLFHHPNIVELAALADHVRRQKHPDNVVTYIVGPQHQLHQRLLGPLHLLQLLSHSRRGRRLRPAARADLRRRFRRWWMSAASKY